MKDLVGVGIGPFNLSLAALAEPLKNLDTAFYEADATFRWHPGMLVPGAMLQVPFLADLVTLVDPTSRWSFLNYQREHDRLFPFYFAERFHVLRREYEAYCRWVAESLPSCRFGASVTAVHRDGDAYVVHADGHEPVSTRNVVLGVGTEPVVPGAFAGATNAFHSASYLEHRAVLSTLDDVTVVGSGQSGAEVFLDLLRRREPGQRRHWITRSPAFAPMEYSKLGLEHFTPDYTAYVRSLDQPVRDELVPSQWQLYKAASAETLAAIHDELYEAGFTADVTLSPGIEVVAFDGASMRVRDRLQGGEQDVRTDAVVLATGYAARRPSFLDELDLELDAAGRYLVDDHYRIADGLYVQNAELHTHGVGAPDLGLGAYRSAVILNAVTGRTAYRLPSRTAFTTFGLR